MTYITSDFDVLGPAASHDRECHAISNFWSPILSQKHTASLGKRKRYDAEEEHNKYDDCFGSMQASDSDPISNKNHIQHQILFRDREPSCSQSSSTALPDQSNHIISNILFSEKRPTKQVKRLSPKSSMTRSHSHLMDVEPVYLPGPAPDLRPCHACNLAPKRKKDLVNYLNCKRCNGRTCYICARQCIVHCGKSICRKCAVEVGKEGESWCLDCFSRDLNS